MPILNYTTKIDSYKTITEIQQILSKHGATKMIVDNDANRNPVALTFCIDFNGNPIAFTLPCNFMGIKKSLSKNKKVPRNLCTDEQALRVGWRILKDWTASQMAIVESELASVVEVFLPYAVMKNGTTLYKHIENSGMKLLNN